jgi:uncharacterized protein (TIGR03546 family)
MNPLRLVKNLLLALHGGGDPRHLAAGFALGALFGLVPKDNLLAALFFVLFFFLRVEKGLAVVSAFFFTPLAWAFDGPAHKLGWALLSAPALAGLWTALYDLPIVPLTRFNNTVVLGNLVIGLLLFAPLYWGFMRFVAYYDVHLRARVEALPIVRAVKGLWIVDRLSKANAAYQSWLS